MSTASQSVKASYEKGVMILASNRGFVEWRDAVVATALLDTLLHHAVIAQIERSRLQVAPTSRIDA